MEEAIEIAELKAKMNMSIYDATKDIICLSYARGQQLLANEIREKIKEERK